MKTILCAFDFSKQSENALITSWTISRIFNWELNVVYFISPNVLGLSTPEIEKQEKEKKIYNFLNEHQINAKIHIKIPSNPIPFEVIEIAKQLNSALISIGRSSYDVSDVNFIGSNALSLKNISEIPILFGTNNPKTSFKNILITINEKTYSLEPLSFAIEFSKQTDAKLHLLNVIESPYNVPIEEIQLQEGKLNENLKNYNFKDIDWHLKIIVSEEASKGILEYANNNEIDLIIMSRRKSLNILERLFYSSTTQRVLRGALIPVLLF
jgi:nucleotide-binding universal stress UspA family protein